MLSFLSKTTISEVSRDQTPPSREQRTTSRDLRILTDLSMVLRDRRHYLQQHVQAIHRFQLHKLKRIKCYSFLLYGTTIRFKNFTLYLWSDILIEVFPGQVLEPDVLEHVFQHGFADLVLSLHPLDSRAVGEQGRVLMVKYFHAFISNHKQQLIKIQNI